MSSETGCQSEVLWPTVPWTVPDSETIWSQYDLENRRIATARIHMASRYHKRGYNMLLVSTIDHKYFVLKILRLGGGGMSVF